LATGANRIAVSGAVLTAADPAGAVRELRQLLSSKS
jgi:thiamine monophosphate synthase